MAKTRAQRKAERRKREATQARRSAQARTGEARAQHDTQVPETADVIEAELAERGADLDALVERDAPAPGPAPEPAIDDDAPAVTEDATQLTAPAPSRADAGTATADGAEAAPAPSRRERRRAERERRERAKASEARRRPREEPSERQRGPIIGFLVSCWAELRRVQWPDRETLIQASAVTVLFIAVAAAYLGGLDAVFNQLVKLIL
jgi:preprotein translocase SecE subunit